MSGGRRIVAVVPDLFFATRIAETARALGVTLLAPSPSAAPAACRAAPPDLILLDLHGPGALDLVRALAADPATRDIPIVGFHSHVDVALREQALAAGVGRVLPRSAFTAKLAELLAGAPGPAGGRPSRSEPAAASTGGPMSIAVSSRPEPSEHAPYYGRYIALVPENDAIAALENQMREVLPLLRAIPESRGAHRYGPDKWSIKEVLGHLIDAERVFAYRALRFARKDSTPLPGFDENQWVPAGRFDQRTLADLIAEWEAVRSANLAFFRSLESEAWGRIGTANDNPMSVRALAFVMAGHGRHHAELLKTRYL